MALSFTRRAPAQASPSRKPAEFTPITEYSVDVKQDGRGQDGLVIQPMAGEVKHPKAPNFWVRLEDFAGNADPTAMRALGRSLGRIAQYIATLDAEGVKAGAWPADGQFKLRTAEAPAKAVAPAAAPAKKSKVAQAAEAAKADGAASVDLDSSLEDLPW